MSGFQQIKKLILKWGLYLQVEMQLLSHTLGVDIEVVRPSCFQQQDFIVHFTDENSQSQLPTVTLIAEDDRHYNVLMS